MPEVRPKSDVLSNKLPYRGKHDLAAMTSSKGRELMVLDD